MPGSAQSPERMLSEFDIISRCFDQPGLSCAGSNLIRQGIGDDCALVDIPEGSSLAFSMDTLVEGVHFPPDADPFRLATRALAVNLSDLAATGAKPAYFTLGLTLPDANEAWLMSFADGLKCRAQKFHCCLAGGDITRGPLTITIQVHGLVPAGRAILRDGAKAGDSIYVTGSLGKAALALSVLDGTLSSMDENTQRVLLDAYYDPAPRIKEGIGLSSFVSAGIDISDGLLGDLGHICDRSGVGARVRLSAVPVDALVMHTLGEQAGRAMALNGGDDYELILTVPADREAAFIAEAGKLDAVVTRIGEIIEGRTVVCLDDEGNTVPVTSRSYNHFPEQG